MRLCVFFVSLLLFKPKTLLWWANWWYHQFELNTNMRSQLDNWLIKGGNLNGHSSMWRWIWFPTLSILRNWNYSSAGNGRIFLSKNLYRRRIHASFNRHIEKTNFFMNAKWIVGITTTETAISNEFCIANLIAKTR